MKRFHVKVGRKFYFCLSIIWGAYLLCALSYISLQSQGTSLRLIIWNIIIVNVFLIFCIMKYVSSNIKSLWGLDSTDMTRMDLLKKTECDGLTGLYNRQTAETLISNYLNSELAIGTLNAFFVLDIDYFKQVNDGFGHVMGDDVLKKMAINLENTFRCNDIKGRLGGDEFIVFMKNVKDKAVVLERAQIMLNMMSNSILENAELIVTTVSIGIAYSNSKNSTFKTLYKNADMALYQAKEKGRNQFQVYIETEGE